MDETTGYRPQAPPKESEQKPRYANKDKPVKGIILEKEVDPNEFSQITTGVLHILNNEDGHPIAAKIQKNGTPITVLSVTDGLGGSGAHSEYFNDENQKNLYSGAWIGARIASMAILNLCKSMEKGIVPKNLKEFKNLLTQQLQENFEKAKNHLTERNQANNRKRHPTTLTTTLIAEKKDKNMIAILKKGDSPVIILTSDEIITTEKPGDGDTPMGDNIICQDRYNLESKTLEIDKNKPFLIITASDGLIKMTNGDMNLLQNVIHQSLSRSENLNDTISHLKTYYDKYAIEWDDTTISMGVFGLENQSLKEWAGTWINDPKITRIDTK